MAAFDLFFVFACWRSRTTVLSGFLVGGLPSVPEASPGLLDLRSLRWRPGWPGTGMKGPRSETWLRRIRGLNVSL